MPKPNYVEMHKNSGFMIGDKVKIARKAKTGEFGWDNVWSEEMDNWVGLTGKIVQDWEQSGFCVKVNERGSRKWFPFFCLEKIEAEAMEEEWLDRLMDDHDICEDYQDFIRELISILIEHLKE